MLPAGRDEGEGFAIPTFDLVPNDVEDFMDELREFRSAFHDRFSRSEPKVKHCQVRVFTAQHGLDMPRRMA